MGKLTDLECRNAKPKENGKPVKKFDGQGLFLHVKPSGKYWRYKYRIEGKERLYAIGTYPEYSLADAREKHTELHRLVSDGIDPYEHAEAEKQKEAEEKTLTFRLVALEWLEKRQVEVKPKTYQDIEKRLHRDVFPSIGDTPIKSLTSQDVLNMIKSIQDRDAFEMANRAKQYTSQVLRYAMARGMADADLTMHITDAMATRRVKHQPALATDEIPEFIDALNRNEARLHVQSRLALEMLMLTFVRPAELAAAEWDEFDLDDRRWIIPSHKMKMGYDHIVPLATQTMDILERLKELNGNRQHLFINQRDPKRPMRRDTLSKGVRLLGFQDRHTAHGFRATARTAIRERLGWDSEIIERQLAHAPKGSLGRAYDRAQFVDQRTKMMQDWANYLDTLKK